MQSLQHNKEAGGQHHAPAVLPSEKTRYLLYRRLAGLEVVTGDGTLAENRTLDISHI